MAQARPTLKGLSEIYSFFRKNETPIYFVSPTSFNVLEIDVEKIQARWADFDNWSQLILKQTEDKVELITKAPNSGAPPPAQPVLPPA